MKSDIKVSDSVKPVPRYLTRRRQLERGMIDAARQIHQRNQELTETNKTLLLLRSIDQLVLGSEVSLKQACSQIAKSMIETLETGLVGLFIRDSLAADQMTLSGSYGSSLHGNHSCLNLASPWRLELKGDWLLGPGSNMIIDLAVMDAAQAAHIIGSSRASLAAVLEQFPLKSLYLVKLMVRSKLVGLLLIGSYSSSSQISSSQTELINSVSEGVGVAIDNKLLMLENEKVLRQLRLSNAKLRSLDEAKDDFISMASHQLRTPLTSIKGYTSMILEGDVGKISPAQRKLLVQSYYSAQRMVFIIADLLNVSRLRTGKFLIDLTAFNLSDVIQEEIDQLLETAKSRKLKLIYQKPAKFPDVLLDETKTRQVIMNFVDNALYYTPAGGKIEVTLQARPSSIEFRVTDNGIGVPRSEQRHLFTKFYRANNARKIRPDGTGLGIFMAKKIIVSQGGSIIFDSKEDKGSTFGFIFNKEKVRVPDQPKPPAKEPGPVRQS